MRQFVYISEWYDNVFTFLENLIYAINIQICINV